MDFDYFELHLGRERTAQRALADHLQPAGAQVWAPLLGFGSDQALVLAPAGRGAEAWPGVISAARDRLTPTLRPAEGAEPEPGGIYVHNWFTIDATGYAEFLRLSHQAWGDFERRFDAKIFGLFAAEPSHQDAETGARRLLLMTRYRDLAEWQKSRDPTSEAMKSFAKRRELTRVSLARACVLMPRS